jgi:uncharacterized protein (TIGR00290 family)
MMDKFIASYSGGKDSILALHKALNAGYQPLHLVTTYNAEKQRSWFHGLTAPVMEKISDSLQIPIEKVETNGEFYTKKFETALRQAKYLGARICVFGDIDIKAHIQWCVQRCIRAGIKPYFPLMKQNRKQLVHEFIEHGYKAHITIVNTSLLDARFLGKPLTHDLIDEIEACGCDGCGENGEYHTFVSEGPIFKCALNVSYGACISKDEYLILPIDIL